MGRPCGAVAASEPLASSRSPTPTSPVFLVVVVGIQSGEVSDAHVARRLEAGEVLDLVLGPSQEVRLLVIGMQMVERLVPQFSRDVPLSPLCRGGRR